MHELGLGQLITTAQNRDAIHIAIVPALAGMYLAPGDRIALNLKGEAIRSSSSIGIVDPFLQVNAISPGEKFWLYLNPGSITSLRHEWTHPAFANEAAPTNNQAAETIADSKAASERWLREYIARQDLPSYERVMAKVLEQDVGWDEDYITFEGVDAHADIPPEFWDHVRVVTGVDVRVKATLFSCSC